MDSSIVYDAVFLKTVAAKNNGNSSMKFFLLKINMVYGNACIVWMSSIVSTLY